MGHVEIIPNEMGNRITPSVVAFTDDERLIGEAAKNQATVNPTRTLYDVKRLIGRKYHHNKLSSIGTLIRLCNTTRNSCLSTSSIRTPSLTSSCRMSRGLNPRSIPLRKLVP